MDKFFGGSVENTGNTNNPSNNPTGKITVSRTIWPPTAHESVVSTTANDTKTSAPPFGTTTTYFYGVSTPSNSWTTTSTQTPSLGSAHPPFQHSSKTVSGFASGSSSKSTLSFSTTSNGSNSTLGVSTAPAFGTISSSGPSTTTSSLRVSTAPAFALPPSTTTSSLGVSNAPAFAFPPSTTTSSLGVSTAPAFSFPPSTTTSSLGVSTAPAFATAIPSFTGPSTTLPISSTMSSTFGVSTPFSVSSTSGLSASLFSGPGFGTKREDDKFLSPLFPGPGFATIPSFAPSTTLPFGSPLSSTFGVSAPFSGFGTANPMCFNMTSSGSSTTLPMGSTMSSTFGVSAPPFSGFGTTSPVSINMPIRPSFAQEFGVTTSPASLFGTAHSFYQCTPEHEEALSGGSGNNKFISISAMGAYKNKSHEELRWEDYQQQRNKGSGLSLFGRQLGATPNQNKSHEGLRWNNYQQNGDKGIGTSSTPTLSFGSTQACGQHSSTTGATNFGQSAGQNGNGASVFGATAGTSNISLTFGVPPCMPTNTCCLHSPGSFPPASIHVFVTGATNAHATNESTGATIAHAANEAWRQSSTPFGHSNMISMSVPLMGSGQNSFPGIMLMLHLGVYNGQTTSSFSALPSSASSFSMANCSNSSAAGSNSQVVDCKFCQNGNRNLNQNQS